MGGSELLSAPELSERSLRAIERAGHARAPREACGLLLIEPDAPDRVVEARNEHLAPTGGYSFRPAKVLARASLQHLSGCVELVVWHTHPRGRAAPSEVDLHTKVAGVRYLVVALHETGPIVTWF